MKVLTGTVKVDRETRGWTLLQPGEQSFPAPVHFEQKFNKSPKVMVALYGLDVDNDVNTRLTVTAQDVKETGFKMVFGKWADTRVNGAYGSWVAIDRD
jgi:hypothetical protein